MSNKELDKEKLNKVTGGSPGARFIVIGPLTCENCGEYTEFTYEEGTETGSTRQVTAYCGKCQQPQIVCLGTK